MTTLGTLPADLTLHIEKSVDIDAPIEIAFDSLIEELGPEAAGPPGHDLSFRFEPFPGGRWYRDLGGDNGHLWGHVQVIKRPTLLEIAGPLFMSYAAVSHVQWRLTDLGDARTRLTLRHQAVGAIDKDHREGVNEGWGMQLDAVRVRVESR